MASVVTPSVEPIKAAETTVTAQKTTSVSEPTKLSGTSPTPPPTPPTPTPTPEAKKEESTTEEKSKESPNESAKKEESNKSSSEKSGSETNQEMASKMDELTKSNNELLGVMRQVLSTLQGPLIVTDSKHSFH
jgi:hypothetical protein